MTATTMTITSCWESRIRTLDDFFPEAAGPIATDRLAAIIGNDRETPENEDGTLSAELPLQFGPAKNACKEETNL